MCSWWDLDVPPPPGGGSPEPSPWSVRGAKASFVSPGWAVQGAGFPAQEAELISWWDQVCGNIAPALMAQVPAPLLPGLWHHQLCWKLWLIQTLQLHIVQPIKLYLRDLKNVKFVFHQCWLTHGDDLCCIMPYHCFAVQAVSDLLWAGTTENVCGGITEYLGPQESLSPTLKWIACMGDYGFGGVPTRNELKSDRKASK